MEGKIFIQVDGNDSGKEVVVVKEGESRVYLERLDNKFRYFASVENFKKHYKEKKNVGTENI